ncbi:PilZ domain-containing protein [Devosia elaeis]|uniref:PilZ domain-containing protein n=1 Tax=Devosia elaeis TaxID=1770058 RepID=UPI000B18D829|nr:PilZ domain-containing protein [Devosia elaeis]
MAEELQNKRSSARRRVLKQARMSFNGGRSTIDCVLRNLSDTGARLKVTSPLGVPDRFELVLLTDKRTLACRVVWRSAEEIGVVFDDGKD